jgi:hypothetical protein
LLHFGGSIEVAVRREHRALALRKNNQDREGLQPRAFSPEPQIYPLRDIPPTTDNPKHDNPKNKIEKSGKFSEAKK